MTWSARSIQVPDQDVDDLLDEYKRTYTMATDNLEAVRYQARVEIGIRRILQKEGAQAYTNTFEILWDGAIARSG